MKHIVEEMLYHQDHITEKLKVWVVDKDIPLEERWDTFIKSGLGEHHVFLVKFKSLGEDFISYDGKFHAERHQTVDVEDIEQILLDGHGHWEGDWEGRWDGDGHWKGEEFIHEEYPEEMIAEFKEEVLEKFLKSFEFDW